MTKTYASIKDILIGKLEDLQGSGAQDLFVQVAGSNITEPDGYPLCYVVERSGNGRIIDTGRNERTWDFSIVIHMQLGQKTEEQADAALLDAADRVIQMFDRDPMLATAQGEAQCSKVEVAPVLFERATQDTAIIRALLDIRVYDLVQRYA